MSEAPISYPIFRKPPAPAVPPNMADYAATCAAFRWRDARARLQGPPGGGLNIAHEAVDRHAAGPSGARVALRWIGKDGTRRDITYAALSGETVFVLLGRVPELYVAMLGALKTKAVVSPPIFRLRAGAAGHQAKNRRCARAGHQRGAVAPQDRRATRPLAEPAPCHPH